MATTTHPNSLDKFLAKIFPRYLYPGQFCQVTATVNVGVVHKLPDITPHWKIMDYLFLKKGSLLKYLGRAKALNFVGEIPPTSAIVELIQPEVDTAKSFGKHASPGDLVCLTSFDRQFITPVPSNFSPPPPLADIITPAPSTS